MIFKDMTSHETVLNQKLVRCQAKGVHTQKYIHKMVVECESNISIYCEAKTA